MFSEKVRAKAEAYAKDKVPNSGWDYLRDEIQTTYMDGARYGYDIGYRAAMTNGCLVIKGSEKGFDLNGLAAESAEISMKRAENGGTEPFSTQNLLKHCATEVIEAMEAYKDYNDIESAQDKKGFASELADIICCCMIIAAHKNIDLEKAIEDCIEKNRKRAEGMGDKK